MDKPFPSPLPGDKVKYIPGLEFSKQRLDNGQFLFKYMVFPKNGSEPYLESDSRKILAYLTKPRFGHVGKYEPAMPIEHWDAVVHSVNDDGSCTLLVKVMKGVTNGIKNVPMDDGSQKLGSYYIPQMEG